MKKIEKSMWVPFHAASMYALVQDVSSYSEFLPWCERSLILEQNDHGIEQVMLAQLDIKFQGLKMSLTTRNVGQAPHQILMILHQGPFQHLVGCWQFSPISECASKVSLTLEYTFSNFFMGKLLGPVFGKLADGLVDAFYHRAQSVYKNV